MFKNKFLNLGKSLPRARKATINCNNKMADELGLEVLGQKLYSAVLGYDEVNFEFILPLIGQMVKVTGIISL